MKKAVIAVIAVFSAALRAPALDLTGVNSKLSSAFSAYIDDNEGLTTFRSLNIPVGGRAESLGTACTGLADDITFFDYNPAASAVLTNTEIAVFHNAWISDSAMETLAATRRSGHLGYGAQIKCFYVPFSEYNLFGEKVAASYYSESSATLNIAYNFLAGYKFKGLAVGLNLRGSWRSIPDYTDNQTDEIISKSGLKQSALGMMGDVGFLVRFNAAKFYNDREPNLKVGLAVNNLGAAITGFGSKIKRDDPLPTHVSLGASYRPFAPILLTAEFRKPINIFDIKSSGIWSAGCGIEVDVTRFCSVESGFLLQGGNPRISMGGQFLLKSFQLNICYTFDLTSSANPVNHISLSAKFRLGDRGRAKLRQQVDDYYLAGLKLYAQGDLKNAILEFDKALEIDKRFDPAIDARTAAKKFIAAQMTLDDLQDLSRLINEQNGFVPDDEEADAPAAE